MACISRPLIGQRAVPRTAVRNSPAKQTHSLRKMIVPMAFSKSDLSAVLAEKANMKKKDAEDAVTLILDTITDQVAKGEKVTIIGFGTFEPRQRAARTGRNPKNGDPIAIPAKTYPFFSAGKKFKEAVAAAKPEVSKKTEKPAPSATK